MQNSFPFTAKVGALFNGQVAVLAEGTAVVTQAYSMDGKPLAPYRLTPAFPDQALLEAFCNRYWVEFLAWDTVARDEGVMVRPFWEGSNAAH